MRKEEQNTQYFLQGKHSTNKESVEEFLLRGNLLRETIFILSLLTIGYCFGVEYIFVTARFSLDLF